MKITKQQVKELKHLINNETCNSSEVKDKIKEILPQLLNPFEVENNTGTAKWENI
jgi:beta-lactamase class D